MRAQKAVLVGNQGEVFVEFHAVVYHRTYLQEAELASSVAMKVDGELNLDGSLHLFLAILKDLLHQLRQREYVVLKDASKGDNLAIATFVEAVVDTLVHRVVGRANPL